MNHLAVGPGGSPHQQFFSSLLVLENGFGLTFLKSVYGKEMATGGRKMNDVQWHGACRAVHFASQKAKVRSLSLSARLRFYGDRYLLTGHFFSLLVIKYSHAPFLRWTFFF